MFDLRSGLLSQHSTSIVLCDGAAFVQMQRREHQTHFVQNDDVSVMMQDTLHPRPRFRIKPSRADGLL